MEEKETIMQTDIPIAQIIADAVEHGWSERQDVAIASKCLLKKEGKCVTRNQLLSIFTRMKPVVSATGKAKKGSSDPNSPWSKTRNYWMLQLLVRFGAARIDNPMLCHDHTKVNPFHLDQIAWRDEKNRKLQVSSSKG